MRNLQMVSGVVVVVRVVVVCSTFLFILFMLEAFLMDRSAASITFVLMVAARFAYRHIKYMV